MSGRSGNQPPTQLLVTTSHSPLIGLNDPPSTVVMQVNEAHRAVQDAVSAFAPDLAVVFAPDHYNGFHYNVMPPFCIGTAATSIGDYGLPSGPLPVDRIAAAEVIQAVHTSGVDAAVSEDMRVDHGLVQPLLRVLGSLDGVPLIPIFINCAAAPLVPAARVAALGRAVGRWATQTDRRVLVLGSGGLSHDPPMPTLATADGEIRDRLLGRVSTTEADRAAREGRTVNAAREFAAGTSRLQELNPSWDRQVMAALAERRIDDIAGRTNDWFMREGGSAAHEVRTWIAAYSTLDAIGAYHPTFSFYRAIPEWLAGFGVASAVPNMQSATIHHGGDRSSGRDHREPAT